MTVERSIREHQREASAASRTFADELERRRLLREGWPPECLNCEERFGTRVARLYPLVGREGAVRTPGGQGTLLRAFGDSPARPGAMVLTLRPRAFFWQDGKKKAAAVFVAIEDVKPHAKGVN